MNRMKNIRGFRILFENKSNYVSILKLKTFFHFQNWKAWTWKPPPACVNGGKIATFVELVAKLNMFFWSRQLTCAIAGWEWDWKKKYKKRGKGKWLACEEMLVHAIGPRFPPSRNIIVIRVVMNMMSITEHRMLIVSKVLFCFLPHRLHRRVQAANKEHLHKADWDKTLGQ